MSEEIQVKTRGMAPSLMASMTEQYEQPIENMDQPPTEEVEQEPDALVELAAILEGIPGAPDFYMLEHYRDQYGRFYTSSVQDDDNIYLWRTLKRQEYKQIAGSGALNNEMTFQDMVIRKCLIWPEPTSAYLATSDAGVIPSLFKQIMFQSGFIPEQLAMSLVRTI